MVRAMLLMLFVLERLQLVVGFLGVDNWDCGPDQEVPFPYQLTRIVGQI